MKTAGVRYSVAANPGEPREDRSQALRHLAAVSVRVARGVNWMLIRLVFMPLAFQLASA